MLKISVIREIQIKTIIIHLYSPTLIAKKKKKKNLNIPSAIQGIEQLEIPFVTGHSAKLYNHLRTIW